MHASLRLALLLLPACASTPEFSVFEQSLRDAGVRCVAVDEEFILYSPYAAARTQRYVSVASTALEDLAVGLGETDRTPILIQLYPRPIEGGEMRYDGDLIVFESAPERPSDRGVLGIAGLSGQREAVGVYVPADRTRISSDGRRITETYTFGGDLSTLRHELTHIIAERAGLAGPQWLDEGLAQLFAHGSLENGELHTDRDAPSLVAARERFSNTSLSLLLAWEETHAGAVEGHVFPAGRPLSHALAVFCIEGDTGPLSERIRRFAAMQPEELEALEPALRAWMGAGMPAPAP